MSGVGAGLTWGSAYMTWANGNGGAMKIAFCFPGQGSQDVGMGRAMAEAFPEARAVYDEASEAVGLRRRALCFEGPLEELTRTEIQQPALVATSIACLRAVETLGIAPDYVIGHSVGEYSALAAAGRSRTATRSRSSASAARRWRRRRGSTRARWPRCSGSRTRSSRSCARSIDNVWPANYNCPGQIVVSGENAAVDRLIEAATARGRPQAVKLRISGAFHSPLVASARPSGCGRRVEASRGRARRRRSCPRSRRSSRPRSASASSSSSS